jgi:hypothetical protein
MVRLIVPRTYPFPVACQLMLVMGIVFPPETRSPSARQLSVLVELEPVLIFEVTEIGLTLAGMERTLSGFASGKLIVKPPNCRLARAVILVERVNVRDTTSPGTVSLKVITLE